MHLCVYVTAPSEEVGRSIAKSILKSRLAACVNIVKNVVSLYWWEGKINDESEVLMIIKTKLALFEDLEREIKALHPYKVPEIIALPLVTGYQPYLDWLSAETLMTDDDNAMRNFSF